MNLLGLEAPRALAILLGRLSGIEEIYLADCRPLAPLQKRIALGDSEHRVIERALKQRALTGLPFWDSVLLELPSSPDAFALLDAVMMHVSFRGQEKALSVEAAIDGGLERLCNEFPTTLGASLTILSEVRCNDGLKRHLPMLDFHAFTSAASQRIVEAVAERLLPHGAIILESGESYHAYGVQLVSDSEFRQFMGQAMLFAPIVDRAYLAHQSIEGRCALRLTSGGGKSLIPRVVAVLGGRIRGKARYHRASFCRCVAVFAF